MLEAESSWFLTTPWERVARRRGAALGLRPAADFLADVVAPGLTNGTVDARWVTLLSWCLKWSHECWSRCCGGDPDRREEQARRYAWLRPLELLWVARTLALDRDGEARRQLPGRRSVAR